MLRNEYRWLQFEQILNWSARYQVSSILRHALHICFLFYARVEYPQCIIDGVNRSCAAYYPCRVGDQLILLSFSTVFVVLISFLAFSSSRPSRTYPSISYLVNGIDLLLWFDYLKCICFLSTIQIWFLLNCQTRSTALRSTLRGSAREIAFYEYIRQTT